MTLRHYVLNGPSVVIADDDRNAFVSWQHHLDRTDGLRGGVDLVAAVGTPILAPTAGWVRRRPNNGSAGNSMWFEHRDNPGWGDVFSHLDRYVGDDGDFFEQGEVIAFSGDTGDVVEHLHRHLEKDGIRHNPWSHFTDGDEAEEVDMKKHTRFQNAHGFPVRSAWQPMPVDADSDGTNLAAGTGGPGLYQMILNLYLDDFFEDAQVEGMLVVSRNGDDSPGYRFTIDGSRSGLVEAAIPALVRVPGESTLRLELHKIRGDGVPFLKLWGAEVMNLTAP